MPYIKLSGAELELVRNSGNSEKKKKISLSRITAARKKYESLKKEIQEKKEKKAKELQNETPEHIFKYAKRKTSNGYVIAQSSNISSRHNFGGTTSPSDPEYVQGILNGSGPGTINGYGIEINGESE